MAGLAVAPNDAIDEVLNVAGYVTNKAGGKGVFREVVELVLKARGLWNKAASKYS